MGRKNSPDTSAMSDSGKVQHTPTGGQGGMYPAARSARRVE